MKVAVSSQRLPFFSYLTVDKTEIGLRITVPNWRDERGIYALALWGMIVFFAFLCYTAWPVRADTPVEFVDCVVFSLLVTIIVFLFGKIVWDSKGKRIVTMTDSGVRIERFCLFRLNCREFSASTLLRLDRNVENISTDRKLSPVLTLDILFDNGDGGLDRCSLPCLNEDEFQRLSETLRPFLPEIDPTPRGNLVQVENEANTLRLLPVNMCVPAPWWTVAISILLLSCIVLGVCRTIEILDMPLVAILGFAFIACFTPALVALSPPFLSRFHRVRCLSLSTDRFEMETSLLGFSRVRRIDFPKYRGLRQTYRQDRTDRPVIWTLEILVGRKSFPVDVGSLREQAELAATINTFLGVDEEKILAEPSCGKFIRDKKGIRFPVNSVNVDVNGITAVGAIVVFLVFVSILFASTKTSPDVLGPGLIFGILAVCIAAATWSQFGKCFIRPAENTLDIFLCFPLYRGKPFVVYQSEIQAVRILPPFADVAETPWGKPVCGYGVAIDQPNEKTIVLPCGAVEEQRWLAEALNGLR